MPHLSHSRFLLSFIFFTAFVLASFSGFSKETELIVRVKAKDAKFIGSSIGGARIIIRENLSGEILAEGLTSGSTGDTEKIMKLPHKRGEALSNEATAGFKATLDIDQPVFVSVEAYGPINKKQATVLSSTQLWLIPGKDILGDGLILEVPGFVIDILSPQTHESITGNAVVITANVVMMCGCPVTKGGLWNAEQYEVGALISQNGNLVKDVKLTIQDKASTFSTKTNLEEGSYEIAVYAFDPKSGNTGLDKTNINISK